MTGTVKTTPATSVKGVLKVTPTTSVTGTVKATAISSKYMNSRIDSFLKYLIHLFLKQNYNLVIPTKNIIFMMMLNEKYLQFICLFKNNNAMPGKKIVHVSLT